MKDAYILFKDHKPNFENKLQSRLINPSKTELGKVSKNIIQNIIINVKKTGNNNLWKNSNDTIEWFKKIKSKSKATFTQFDITDFNPSIMKNILIDSINNARKYVEITEEKYKIILACRKTFLKNNGSTWVKTGSENFDVPMEGYDSAQIADLVGLYILDTLSRIINPVQIGLYHNDGLIYISSSDGPCSSSKQKKIIRAFKSLGFRIEFFSNIKIANFLDVTLNLSDSTYQPFLKTDQYPSYINVNSDHLNAIIKQVPKAVNMRIRRLSSSMKIFQDSNKMYTEVLKSSRFREKFTYQETKMSNKNNLYMNKENTKCSQKNRKRKIIWFNPTFCTLVNINVGKYFLKLIDKHFNILHKIFNRKTLKISYSCRKNFFEIINNHNKEIIKKYNV